MTSEPITVSIRRDVDPAHIAEATAWVQTGMNLANKYPGFLGSGWIRAGENSHIWHMLYRFADAETLERWENSPERTWWLSMGEGFVRSERSARRTGIEGWFDVPATGSTALPEQTNAAPAPARWKQAIAIWLGFFPVNLAFSYAASPVPGWDTLPLWLRVLVTTLVLTPIMTYAVLPWVTRMLRSWLAR
ncbi:antibiotic biosynthesis monooxygenase [Microbacterium sp. NIBRBAC000506063]|uniref:antibiotic biosynthesis monooxygenase n=1 Tax=Microbacterium sp. NIBRBAC000506063 TaxID=2734618 RepID=UPI001BB4C46B|nr:antibiotic biosynthesis monooxygenase [Microbacterium sp. NIBRBAC000506063]QTV79039.1 antibiotic biosynthesis monooxygenase [Microbacterium sp. NIBRBAC000506063]